jgi:hypothetical protein
MRALFLNHGGPSTATGLVGSFDNAEPSADRASGLARSRRVPRVSQQQPNGCRDRASRSIFDRFPSETPRSLRCRSVKSGRTAVSMSFSANLSAYSDVSSLLSQSAVCRIAAIEVGHSPTEVRRRQQNFTPICLAYFARMTAIPLSCSPIRGGPVENANRLFED